MKPGATTTTVATLDTRNQFTWQNITIVAIGFTVTLAAAFTGCYKYRERSYFLLQTADAIEEEANAFALGVGHYSNFDADQDQEALKLFTQRVEEHRNERDRRQQQLDQPADQAAPSGPPPSA
ncbi:SLATT domain-containing protein [Streptomyces sp. NPDC094049]|uniref:SLATT domain-containing protein n=1 Tax=Streptomyces sp. NPDC094049 TaxID=3154987 RepID=UPI0033260E9C